MVQTGCAKSIFYHFTWTNLFIRLTSRSVVLISNLIVLTEDFRNSA
jgi:hypothetical protein